MAVFRNYQILGINLKVSPFIPPYSQNNILAAISSNANIRISPFNSQYLLRAVNVETSVIGVKKKRSGYITYLGTPDNAQVNTLFDWHRNNGTQFWNYRASGSQLYYSQQGTGAWTVCGNGTIPNGDYIYQDILEDQLVITSPNGTARLSSDGTSFTDIAAAPVGGVGVSEFQNRMWIAGTASKMFYSTVGTPNDWTTDSSSIAIPGAGRLQSLFKNNNRLVATKNSGLMFRWDGVNLTDQASNLGPTSPQSMANVESAVYYLNRLGVYGYTGNAPELVSNPVEPFIYNDDQTGIVGTVFNNAPGVIHKYNYYLTVGSVTDDLTGQTVNPCTLVHDYQKDEWMTWETATQPTAWNSFADANGNQQLIFGDGTGQCYQISGTATSDNGTPITATMEGMLAYDQPENDKIFRTFWATANPGCQATVQVATGNTFTKGKKIWQTVGDLQDGNVEYRFPGGSKAKILFYKISESSTNAKFHFYGMATDVDMDVPK